MGGETPPLRRGTLLLCDLGGDRRAAGDSGPYGRFPVTCVGADVLIGPQSWTSCPGYAMVGGVISGRYPPDFAHSGPSGPAARRGCHSDFARRTQLPRKQEGVPRKWGSGGKPPMSTRCAKVLIEGGPQRRFGYFAAVGKVTLASPPRRAELSSRKTSLCSAAPTAAH